MSFSWDLSIVAQADVRRMEERMKRFGTEKGFYMDVVFEISSQLKELEESGKQFVPNYRLAQPQVTPNVEVIDSSNPGYDFSWHNCAVGCSAYYAAYMECYFRQVILPEHKKMVIQYQSFDNFSGKFMELEADILALGGEIQPMRPKIKITLPVTYELDSVSFEIVPNPRSLHILKGKIRLLYNESPVAKSYHETEAVESQAVTK